MYTEKLEWPDDKKCVAMITVNLNAELFWLQLDPGCIDMPKTLSLGQYGMKRGLDRILDILESRNIKATFFVPGWIAENYSEDIETIQEKGHEIAALGYAHENMALLTEEEQDAVMKKSISAIEKVCSTKPKGFRSPEGELTLDTLRIAKKNGMNYSSNLSDDDRPYYKDLGNDMDLLEIPIHWANYDLPYFAFNYKPAFPAGQGRIANYSGVLSNWIKSHAMAMGATCTIRSLTAARWSEANQVEIKPPRTNRQKTTISVVAEVMMVRDRVWFTDWLMTEPNDWLALRVKLFSRIRSNTIMVSLSE